MKKRADVPVVSIPQAARTELDPGPWQRFIYGGHENPWKDAAWLEKRYKLLCAQETADKTSGNPTPEATAEVDQSNDTPGIFGITLAKERQATTGHSVAVAGRGRPRAQLPLEFPMLAAQGLGYRRVTAELRRLGYDVAEQTVARGLARLRHQAATA